MSDGEKRVDSYLSTAASEALKAEADAEVKLPDPPVFTAVAVLKGPSTVFRQPHTRPDE